MLTPRYHMTSDDVTRCSSAGVCQYLSCSFLQRGDGAAAVRGGTPRYIKQTHPQHHHHACTHTFSLTQWIRPVMSGVYRCVQLQTDSRWVTWRSSSVFLWPGWFSPAAECLKIKRTESVAPAGVIDPGFYLIRTSSLSQVTPVLYSPLQKNTTSWRILKISRIKS